MIGNGLWGRIRFLIAGLKMMFLFARHLNSNRLHFAKSLRPYELSCQTTIMSRTFVAAALQDSTGTSRGVTDDHALAIRVGERFFAIDILARSHCSNRSNAVPMVGRRNMDRVDVASLQQLPKILESGTVLIAIVFVDFIGGLGEVIFVDITDGNELDPFVLKKSARVVPALSSAANRGHDDSLTRSYRSRKTQRRGRNKPSAKTAADPDFRNSRREQLWVDI